MTTKKTAIETVSTLIAKLHLLWDYDNTLGLTEFPAFTACCKVVNQTLESKGVDFRFTTESLMARFVGYSFRRMITELAEQYQFGFDDTMTEVINGVTVYPELEILVQREVDAVVAQLAKDIKPTSGVNPLLARLLDAGYQMSVVSSSAEVRVRACLKGADQEGFFPTDQIFSAANYKSSKPDPRVYLEALKALGLEASDCVAMEDSKTGVLAARAAGILVIGYVGAYPEHEHEEFTKVLLAAGAFVVIKTWDEYEAVLAELELSRVGCCGQGCCNHEARAVHA